jgi:trans-2,3-dihydro-3-hydroxyanthranilate isomerase
MSHLGRVASKLAQNQSTVVALASTATAGYLMMRARKSVVATPARGAATSAASTTIPFETLDVFTPTKYGGNPLAVVFDLEQKLTDDEMQKIAMEFGYSETTFVLPPKDPENNTAWVRIFSPTAEMPFAGHPNVGTATALAWRGELFGKPIGDTVLLEEKAGIVPLDILHDAITGRPTGALLTAPEEFRVEIKSLPVDTIAQCLGIEEEDVVTKHHDPLVATCGLPFIIAELTSLEVRTQ